MSLLEFLPERLSVFELTLLSLRLIELFADAHVLGAQKLVLGFEVLVHALEYLDFVFERVELVRRLVPQH